MILELSSCIIGKIIIKQEGEQMITSMTGFGRGDDTQADKKMTVEIKSVNHRYCEVNVRMPRKLGFLENDIKNHAKKRLSRGKIDVFVSYEDNSEKKESIRFNQALTEEYLSYFDKISELFDLENDIKVSHVARYPDVLVLEEQEDDEDLLWRVLKSALDKAIDKMIDTRQTEGTLLYNDILIKLEAMETALAYIKERSPAIVEEYKERLTTRIKELSSGAMVDENRLATEVLMFADRACIDEEIVRLESHITHMKQTMKTDQAVGRKLDFLAQEMNREANTILSKANNIDVSNQAIDLKSEIEKIREQIQNIE